MKLTDQEIQFFKDLSKSQMAAFFHNYMTRVRDYAYDSRSWGEGVTKESASHAAKLIQELVIDKIRPPQSSGQVDRAEYD